jgi:hypothetical protein
MKRKSRPWGVCEKKGGGRKAALSLEPHLEEAFLEVMADHTAGSPQREIMWTNLGARETAELMSRRVVAQLFKRHGFVLRQAQKKKSGDVPKTVEGWDGGCGIG